jgi:hypothetical protein
MQPTSQQPLQMPKPSTLLMRKEEWLTQVSFEELSRRSNLLKYRLSIIFLLKFLKD